MKQRQPFVRGDFEAGEFRRRCQQVIEEIGEQAIAVIPGAAASGAFDVFRQTNEFYYLCGIEVPQCYLLLDGHSRSSCLYLPAADERLERSEGAVVNASDVDLVINVSGVDQLKEHQALAGDLQDASEVWLPLSPGERRQMCRDVISQGVKMRDGDPWDDWKSREERFLDLVRGASVTAQVRDICPLLDGLREVKSERELELMREAGRLTGAAVLDAMQATKEGIYEFQLAALAEQTFLSGGAFGGAYRAIVACGDNIWNAHYFRNNAQLQAGQLVLMDYAPDYSYYTSDIGRMWPVNGRYDDQQRELYGYMVQYHKVLLDHIRPGVTAEQVMQEAADKMRPVVETTDWSRQSFRDAAQATLDFQGHLSHGVGMSVHDVGDYRKSELQEGFVFALDPQMWVPSEQIYVRVEDTVAVTPDGVEVLTDLAPLELADVEAVIGRQPLIG